MRRSLLLVEESDGREDAFVYGEVLEIKRWATFRKYKVMKG